MKVGQTDATASESEVESAADIDETPNASFQKLSDYPVMQKELDNSINRSNDTNFTEGYQIMDMDIMSATFQTFACPVCFQVGNMSFTKIKKQGLAIKFSIKCDSCQKFIHSFWTSKKPTKVRSFDINKRLFYAMRRMGKGYAGMKRFLTLMNLPPPMTEANYQKLA